MKELHQIYHSQPALHSDDFTNEGFEWIDCQDMPRGMISYMRKDKYSDDVLIVVCNFKPNLYQNYWVGVREPGLYQELFNTDAQKYGGSGMVNQPHVETRQWNSDPWPHALEIVVPPISVITFKKNK